MRAGTVRNIIPLDAHSPVFSGFVGLESFRVRRAEVSPPVLLLFFSLVRLHLALHKLKKQTIKEQNHASRRNTDKTKQSTGQSADSHTYTLLSGGVTQSNEDRERDIQHRYIWHHDTHERENSTKVYPSLPHPKFTLVACGDRSGNPCHAVRNLQSSVASSRPANAGRGRGAGEVVHTAVVWLSAEGERQTAVARVGVKPSSRHRREGTGCLPRSTLTYAYTFTTSIHICTHEVKGSEGKVARQL